MKIKYSNKIYLNENTSEFGGLCWSIEPEEFMSKYVNNEIMCACVRINDCSRNIILNFDFQNDKELDQAILKAITLRNEVDNFIEHLYKCKPLYSKKFYY